MLRDRDGSTPRSDVPSTSRLRVRDAVFASPALLPAPALDGRLGIAAFLLPDSFVLPPEVPPPRSAV